MGPQRSGRAPLGVSQARLQRLPGFGLAAELHQGDPTEALVCLLLAKVERVQRLAHGLEERQACSGCRWSR